MYIFSSPSLGSFPQPDSVVPEPSNSQAWNRYMPFGETRTINGTTNITETDFGYTGQRDYSDDFGLMDSSGKKIPLSKPISNYLKVMLNSF